MFQPYPIALQVSDEYLSVAAMPSRLSLSSLLGPLERTAQPVQKGTIRTTALIQRSDAAAAQT
jgi:hypothetical protein